MKTLRQFDFHGNPLGTIPEEITKKGIAKVLTYLREMQGITSTIGLANTNVL